MRPFLFEFLPLLSNGVCGCLFENSFHEKRNYFAHSRLLMNTATLIYEQGGFCSHTVNVIRKTIQEVRGEAPMLR